MTPRPRGRTRPCSHADAKALLDRARKFVDVAELLVEDSAPGELAGPAATLLAEIRPGGEAASNALRRLLGVKDAAHYGVSDISGARLSMAMTQARELVAFAASIEAR